MHRDAYTDTSILIVGSIYILAEFIFKEKGLNEISENKFSSKITRYIVTDWDIKISYILTHSWVILVVNPRP